MLWRGPLRALYTLLFGPRISLDDLDEQARRHVRAAQIDALFASRLDMGDSAAAPAGKGAHARQLKRALHARGRLCARQDKPTC